MGQAIPLTLLVHVPKCAGTTVESYVEKMFPGRTLYPRRRRGPFGIKLRSYDLAPDRDLSHIDFVSGHDFGRSIIQYFPGRTFRAAVLLRDPIEQILSCYNYHMQQCKDAGKNVVPFGLWYRRQRCNPLTEFLLERYLDIAPTRLHVMCNTERLQIATGLLESFWYVGRHTQCGELIARIAEERGVSPQFERQNTTREYIVSLDDLSPRMRDRLHRDTGVDRALFERFLGSGAAASVDRGGRMRMLLKDLQRPSSTCAYRLVRAGRIPARLYA